MTISEQTLDRLAYQHFPPGVDYAAVRWIDNPDTITVSVAILLWTNMPYLRCPGCHMHVGSPDRPPAAWDASGGCFRERPAACECGNPLLQPWAEVRQPPDGELLPVHVLTTLDELLGEYRAQVRMARKLIRGRLRRELSAALLALQQPLRPFETIDARRIWITTGSQTEPGVYFTREKRWAAWDFDPDRSGDQVKLWEDEVPASLDFGRKRTPLDQLKVAHGLSTYAASAYLHAAKGDVALAMLYASLGPTVPVVGKAIFENPVPHLRYPIYTTLPPLELQPNQKFRHMRAKISPQVAQMFLDRYTPAPGQRQLSEQQVEILIERLANPDPGGERHESIAVACNGQTIRGKHLLHAVVRSGVTVETDVIYNESLPSWLREAS